MDKTGDSGHGFCFEETAWERDEKDGTGEPGAERAGDGEGEAYCPEGSGR
jgi:hypothetical protein